MNRSVDYATYLINESIKLESSNCYSINHYMVQYHGMDWKENEIYRFLAEDLNNMMYLEKIECKGYTLNQWHDR